MPLDLKDLQARGKALLTTLTEQIEEGCDCEDCRSNVAERRLILLGLSVVAAQLETQNAS